jgi:UDP-N-acetylmuramoyl-tripeptide--D-alanyl-D-alanine ligase
MDLRTCENMKFESVVNGCDFFSSDSRSVTEASVFVALKGESHDGHEFVSNLLKAHQNIKVVVDRDKLIPEWKNDSRLVVVEDTHVAHREIARLFRERFAVKVIAVGGSSGKTSAKEFLRTLLEPHFETIATQKSQNGELGIPKTLESLRKTTQVAVIEVGIDSPGDMARHAAIVQPDLAVLTSIGEEHLAYLKDVETVFREETQLFEACWKKGGMCFAPEADAFLSRLKGRKSLQLTPDQPDRLDPRFRSELSHPYALRNAALAASVALHLGLSPEIVAQDLLSLEIPEGRGRSWKTSRGQTVIADHYNSNPASLRAGLAHLKSFSDRGEGVNLVLGDMLELGEESLRYHAEILDEVKALAPQRILLIGPQFCEAAKQSRLAGLSCYSDSDEAAKVLTEELRALKGIVMFKGSRGMRLERLIELL